MELKTSDVLALNDIAGPVGLCHAVWLDRTGNNNNSSPSARGVEREEEHKHNTCGLGSAHRLRIVIVLLSFFFMPSAVLRFASPSTASHVPSVGLVLRAAAIRLGIAAAGWNRGRGHQL